MGAPVESPRSQGSASPGWDFLTALPTAEILSRHIRPASVDRRLAILGAVALKGDAMALEKMGSKMKVELDTCVLYGLHQPSPPVPPTPTASPSSEDPWESPPYPLAEAESPLVSLGGRVDSARGTPVLGGPRFPAWKGPKGAPLPLPTVGLNRILQATEDGMEQLPNADRVFRRLWRHEGTSAILLDIFWWVYLEHFGKRLADIRCGEVATDDLVQALRDDFHRNMHEQERRCTAVHLSSEDDGHSNGAPTAMSGLGHVQMRKALQQAGIPTPRKEVEEAARGKAMIAFQHRMDGRRYSLAGKQDFLESPDAQWSEEEYIELMCSRTASDCSPREVKKLQERLFERVAVAFCSLTLIVPLSIRDTVVNAYCRALSRSIHASYLASFPYTGCRERMKARFAYEIKQRVFQWASGVKICEATGGSTVAKAVESSPRRSGSPGSPLLFQPVSPRQKSRMKKEAQWQQMEGRLEKHASRMRIAKEMRRRERCGRGRHNSPTPSPRSNRPQKQQVEQVVSASWDGNASNSAAHSAAGSASFFSKKTARTAGEDAIEIVDWPAEGLSSASVNSGPSSPLAAHPTRSSRNFVGVGASSATNSPQSSLNQADHNGGDPQDASLRAELDSIRRKGDRKILQLRKELQMEDGPAFDEDEIPAEIPYHPPRWYETKSHTHTANTCPNTSPWSTTAFSPLMQEYLRGQGSGLQSLPTCSNNSQAKMALLDPEQTAPGTFKNRGAAVMGRVKETERAYRNERRAAKEVHSSKETRLARDQQALDSECAAAIRKIDAARTSRRSNFDEKCESLLQRCRIVGEERGLDREKNLREYEASIQELGMVLEDDKIPGRFRIPLLEQLCKHSARARYLKKIKDWQSKMHVADAPDIEDNFRDIMSSLSLHLPKSKREQMEMAAQTGVTELGRILRTAKRQELREAEEVTRKGTQIRRSWSPQMVIDAATPQGPDPLTLALEALSETVGINQLGSIVKSE